MRIHDCNPLSYPREPRVMEEEAHSQHGQAPALVPSSSVLLRQGQRGREGGRKSERGRRETGRSGDSKALVLCF